MNPIPCPECGAPVLMVQTVQYRWPLEPQDVGREASAVTGRSELEPEATDLRIICSKDQSHQVGPAVVKDPQTGRLVIDGLPRIPAALR